MHQIVLFDSNCSFFLDLTMRGSLYGIRFNGGFSAEATLGGLVTLHWIEK